MPILTAGLIVVIASAIVMPVSAITPPYPGSIYIKDVTVGNSSDPLNYNSGGVRILLTPQGDSVGMWWNGAWALSYFTIESWESQTGKFWPYHWRSRESVATEIKYHCWIFDTTSRVTTISFNDGWMCD